MSTPLRLLVTRPQPQADAWVTALRQAGQLADALPLIATMPAHDPEAVAQAWHALPRTRLVMFVSPAAVHGFFAHRPPQAPWPAGTLAAAPGPGTRRVLARCGEAAGLQGDAIVSPAIDAEQFDSEHLWPLLAPMDWTGAHVLLACGGQEGLPAGRPWLTQQWQARGATVSPLVCYQRTAGSWTPDQQAMARTAIAEPQRHLWLFSASEALKHLSRHHIPALELGAPVDWSRAHALCTHPRVAEQARALGFGHVVVCQPLPAAVAAHATQTGHGG